MIVWAGQLHQTKDESTRQDQKIDSVIIHVKYNNTNLHYDIAILFFNAEFFTLENIGWICLSPQSRGSSFENKLCDVTGFGNIKCFIIEDIYNFLL